MQKKMVGIIASVAVAHGVLAIALMTGGGCRQTKILAPHTYNNGPEVSQVPAAVDKPAQPAGQIEVPPSGGSDAPLPPPVEQKPQFAPVVTPPVMPPATAGTKTYKVKKGDTLSAIAYKHGLRTRDLAACNNLSGNAMNRIRIGQELVIPEGGVYNESRKVKTSGKKSAVKPRKKSGKKAKATAALPADGIYVVKSGDSLDRIGRRYGVSAKAIAKENDIALTKILQIGDKLRIPGKSAAPAAKTDTPVDNGTTTSTGTTVNSDALLNDLDPTAGLENNNSASPAATDTTAAPAADSTETVTTTTADPVKYDSLEVPEDMTVEDFCKRNNVSVEEIRKLNPEIPADGKLKAGAYLTLPRMQN